MLEMCVTENSLKFKLLILKTEAIISHSLHKELLSISQIS